MKSISRSPLSIAVIEEIMAYIQENNLRPGDKLPTEEEFCVDLEVSRTSVRESMKALKGRGLVESIPGRGTYLVALDFGVVSRTISSLLMFRQCSLRDVFGIRYYLELSLSREAAIRASDLQLAEAMSIFERLKEHSNDLEKVIVEDRNFHVAVAKMSGNELGAFLVGAMMEATLGMRRSIFVTGMDLIQMHEGIIKGIEARDPEETANAMTFHFGLMEEVFDKHMPDKY